uniref:Uncharacterized protein n=1 Tax=Lygus hesperus TaxID=30085 RepID=A0A0A9XIG5_LYGHE
MARSRKRNARRRRRRGAPTTALPTRTNDIIKGTILPNHEVLVNINDFSDIPKTVGQQLLFAKVTCATTTLADVSVVFYNSKTRNVALRSFNFTLCNSKKTVMFRWPPRTLRAGNEFGQLLVQIVNAACNEEDVREKDIWIWYSCQVWTASVADVFNSTVDPPHLKHGTPRSARSLTLDSMAI